MTRLVLVAALISAFIGSCEGLGGDCPSVCPGDCFVGWAFWRDVKSPEIGVTRVRCLEATCPLRPWCFEVFAVVVLPFVSSRYRVFGGLVSEATQDFLCGWGVTAWVRDELATVCVPFGYEVPIVIPGPDGKAAIFQVPVGRIEGVACMGKCYCSGLWLPPHVEVLPVATESPRRVEFLIRASDPDGDIVCVWHDYYTSIKPIPEMVAAPTAELRSLSYFVGDCSYAFGFELPCSTEAGTVAVFAWAKDAKGLVGSTYRRIAVASNKPPVALPPVLEGKTTVILTSTGVERTPVVFQPIKILDPDEDPVTVEGNGLPPMYAGNLSAFLGSLVALYTPGGLTDEDLCYAVREKDVLIEIFSSTFHDSLGATIVSTGDPTRAKGVNAAKINRTWT